jgi:hypothetical protein
MSFRVLVDDNFNYMNESERYELGSFPTLEAAIQAAQAVVDDYLANAIAQKPDITEDELFASYASFGEDPFIRSESQSGVLFSARDYARKRCRELKGG